MPTATLSPSMKPVSIYVFYVFHFSVDTRSAFMLYMNHRYGLYDSQLQ